MLLGICVAISIILESLVVVADMVNTEANGIATRIDSISGTDRQGNATNLEVLMPDWNQISFSTMPGVLTAGGFEDTSLNQAAGYDISRQWGAGETPDQYLKLGDISEALKSEEFSLDEVASITQLDLQQVALSAFPLAGEQTLEHLVNIVPGLDGQMVQDVALIAALVENINGSNTSLSGLTIGELVEQNPSIGQSKLNQIELSKYSLNSIPNLDSVELEKFSNWENSYLKEIPGLGQVPLGSYPNPIAEVGNIVARIDMAYGKAETKRYNTVSGSDVKGFNVPCQQNCAYVELDNLENQGRVYRASFEGKQWISGKYQKVKGGHGACGKVNNGKEPTGRLPFGPAFKVVVWDVVETTDTVDTALFFRINCGWLGKTPYIIGPIPFFSYKVNAPIFVGLLDPFSTLKIEVTESETSPETLSNTTSVTENAARITSAVNDVVSGVQVAGISVDALAEAIASVESSGSHQAVGPYVCADNSTNCGRALGKYQYMSYDPNVQALIATKLGGQEFLEQLEANQPVTEEQVFKFFPPDDQDQLFTNVIANKIEQTGQESDPKMGKLFTGERLLERVAQKHFGGDASQIDGTTTDAIGELTLYEYGKKILEKYLQEARITVAP